MSKVADTEQWPANLSNGMDLQRVKTLDGRTIAVGPALVNQEIVLHYVSADDSEIGACVEVARWRRDNKDKEFEIEIIPMSAVASIVWRDPKRR